MQAASYNVWGRLTRDREAANTRAAKALANNPEIQNLHIEIVPIPHYYTHTKEHGVRLHYRACWYDQSVALKAARAEEQMVRVRPPIHICDCEFCDIND